MASITSSKFFIKSNDNWYSLDSNDFSGHQKNEAKKEFTELCEILEPIIECGLLDDCAPHTIKKLTNHLNKLKKLIK